MIKISDYVKELKGDYYCICQFHNDLVIVPCEGHMSGFYANYDEKIILKENTKLEYKKKNNHLDNIDGVLVDTIENTISLVYDSWDGFQIADEISIDSYFEFISEICDKLK